MTPDQIAEAAKLIRSRTMLKSKLDDIEGRLRKLGVELTEQPVGKR